VNAELADAPHPFPLPAGEGEGEGVFRRFLLASIFLFLASTHLALALDVPPLKARVNDYAGLMAYVGILEERLANFEQETGHQIAVLTVPSLEGEDIESFGIKVAEKWKIGKKGVDNGVILIVALKDRKLRIEVGYGLEGVLPDAIANRIIQETIVPRFRAGDFSGGINDGVEAIMKAVRGEALPQKPTASRPEVPSGTIAFLGLLFLTAIVAFMIGLVQASPLRAALSSLAAGGLLGAAVWASGRAKGMTILLASGAVGVYANHYARKSWGRAWSVGGSEPREPWAGNTFVGSPYAGDGGASSGSGGGGAGGGGGGGGGGGFGGGGASGNW